MNSIRQTSQGQNQATCAQCSLKKFSVFKNCSSTLLEEVFSHKALVNFNAKDKLMKQGDSFEGVYCIQKGVLKITKEGKKGKEFILWFAKPGDIIGLDSFINNENYSFTAIAIEPVCACFIPAGDFKYLLRKQPSITIGLMKDLCDKITFIEERLTSLSRKKIREHFAEVLISLAVKGKNSSDGDVAVSYSVKDMANILGTTRNYLYKIMNEFSRKNLIGVRNRKVVIKNFDKLSLVAIGDEAS